MEFEITLPLVFDPSRTRHTYIQPGLEVTIPGQRMPSNENPVVSRGDLIISFDVHYLDSLSQESTTDLFRRWHGGSKEQEEDTVGIIRRQPHSQPHMSENYPFGKASDARGPLETENVAQRNFFSQRASSCE